MEKELVALIKELFEMDELHQEYTDNDISFAIDTQKVDNNTLEIKVTLNEGNKDKKEFEQWVRQIPDDIFSEILESLDDDIYEKYNSEKYMEIINQVRSKANSILLDRMSKYKGLLS